MLTLHFSVGSKVICNAKEGEPGDEASLVHNCVSMHYSSHKELPHESAMRMGRGEHLMSCPVNP